MLLALHLFGLNLLFATSMPAVFPLGTRAATPSAAPVALPASNRTAEKVLYAFQGLSDGSWPQGSLLADASGALFGTTVYGGGAGCGKEGCGTVFKLTPSGKRYTETVLYRFRGSASDGANPYGSVIEDRAGALYGTTSAGAGSGTVYKLTPNASGYSETILHVFGGAGDGVQPVAGLTFDADGTLYGTTEYGGFNGSTCGAQGCGIVFKLESNGSGYTVIHAFDNADGLLPFGPLLIDASGRLFGTAEGGQYERGVVFRLTPGSSGYQETILHTFAPGEGNEPFSGLISDGTGSLYGMTFQGGADNDGTVYRLTPAGSGYSMTILHSFQETDGAWPRGGLLFDSAGDLFGTTNSTGAGGISGVVFKLTPGASEYAETNLFAFPEWYGKLHQGLFPGYAGVIMDGAGRLYGTTTQGGSPKHCKYGCGVVYRITP